MRPSRLAVRILAIGLAGTGFALPLVPASAWVASIGVPALFGLAATLFWASFVRTE